MFTHFEKSRALDAMRDALNAGEPQDMAEAEKMIDVVALLDVEYARIRARLVDHVGAAFKLDVPADAETDTLYRAAFSAHPQPYEVAA